MATLLKVGIYFLWILLCTKLTAGDVNGPEVQLSSSLKGGQSVACVGEHVTFECTGTNIVLMTWIMEPFVSSSYPVSFNPTQEEGFCLDATNDDQLVFCLTHISPSPDGTTADMTTTLKFVAAETMDGAVIMCNEKTITLRVIKYLPPPALSDLSCNISQTFCDNSTSRVICTWTPLLDHNIASYKFNITYQSYGQLSSWIVAANETSLEFYLMCQDSVEIVAFGVNTCNEAGDPISIRVPGNCSECNGGNAVITVAVTVGTLAIAAVLLIASYCIIGVMVYCVAMNIKRKPHAQLQITWRKCKDLPLRMSHMHIVKIGDRLFYGGGYTESRRTANKLYTCTCTGTELSDWRKLPGKCPVAKFALTHYAIDSKVKLVTVGGVEERYIHNLADSGYSTESILAAEVYVYPIESEQPSTDWEIGLKNLNEPRLYPTAANYKINNREYILVCGGIPNVHDLDLNHADYTSTDAVEIYDGQNWSVVSHLPMNRNCLSMTNINQNFYVVGGGEAQKVTNDAAKLLFNDNSSQWEKIQNCPLAGSTAVEVGEKLYVVGGRNVPKWWSLTRKSEVKQSVYVYSNGKWEEVLVKEPAPAIYMAAAINLSGTEFIMIGGQCIKDKPESSVYVGTISKYER